MNDYADVYLTPEQAAERLQLGVETVYRWLRSGKLRGSRISQKAWRVSERELTSFIKRQNVSELLFEEYATECNLGRLEHEPPFPGTTKRVDYRLLHNGQMLWFEVKEFADDRDLFNGNGGGPFDPHVGVRKKISKAAAKFRDYDGQCCSLVLFNERVNLVDICTVGFRIPINRETGTPVGPSTNVFMDGGKLIHPHVKTPQNTTISAVIALDRLAVGQRKLQIKAEQTELKEQRSLKLEEYLNLLETNRAAYGRKVLRTIVYENPHAAKPLPRDIFVGPFDERWGQSGDYIAPVYTGKSIEELNRIEHDLGLDLGPLQRHLKKKGQRPG
jgi:excisionase family DNA binding protein